MCFWIAMAAVTGFLAGTVTTFLFGIAITQSGECDGPCFDKWNEVSFVSFGVGVLVAVLSGLAVRALLRR